VVWEGLGVHDRVSVDEGEGVHVREKDCVDVSVADGDTERV
jgi:hypothetical protein